MRIETERLMITEMTMDMAPDVHKNSLDEDIRRFVPDEVFETVEEAQETIEFIISQYGMTEGPLIYAVLTKEGNTNIGYVQLVPIGDGKWEIGYHVAKAYTCNGSSKSFSSCDNGTGWDYRGVRDPSFGKHSIRTCTGEVRI